MTIRTTDHPDATIHGDGPPPDWRPTPERPATDGPAPLEYREAVAGLAGEHHPAVAAVIAAAEVEHRRRQRRRSSRLVAVR